MKKFSRILMLLFVFASGAQPGSVLASSGCASQAQALQHDFSSGAGWQLCWQLDAQLGLLLSKLAYTSPSTPSREVFEQIHIAGLLVHYDDSAAALDAVSDSGLGAQNALLLSANNCAGEIKIDTDGHAVMCLREHYRDTLTRYAGAQILPRRSITLVAHAKVGAQVWSIEYELTEDGMIIPATIMSGQLERFGTDPLSGTAIDNTGRYATNATLVSVWRMDINIDGSAENDLIEQIQFESDQSPGVRRRMSVQLLRKESSHTVNAAVFRGWRFRDAELSASSDGANLTRIGYYLDPQSSGYRYSSNRLNWANFEFFVSENKACERTALNNQRRYPNCGDSLDDYIADAAVLEGRDPVVWFSQTARFRASASDWPVILSRRTTFKLIPFDWSETSPFPNSLPGSNLTGTQ